MVRSRSTVRLQNRSLWHREPQYSLVVLYVLITSYIKVMSRIQRPLRPASVLSMMMMMNAHRAVFGCITYAQSLLRMSTIFLLLMACCTCSHTVWAENRTAHTTRTCLSLLSVAGYCFFSIKNRLHICVLSSALLRLLWRLLCCTVLHMTSDGVISQTRSSPPTDLQQV